MATVIGKKISNCKIIQCKTTVYAQKKRIFYDFWHKTHVIGIRIIALILMVQNDILFLEQINSQITLNKIFHEKKEELIIRIKV